MIETYAPGSSNIETVTYDDATQQMNIVFKDGSEYQYDGVPVNTFMAMQHAPSAGQYFIRSVKDRYPYMQI